MKKKSIRCHCGSVAVLRDASFVYGQKSKSTARLYVCSRYPECDSYVTADEKTLQPRGPLADTKTRQLRIEAHRAFDRIWQCGIMSRSEAYRWLSDRLCMTRAQAHIGQFSEYWCRQVILESKRVLENNRIAC